VPSAPSSGPRSGPMTRPRRIALVIGQLSIGGAERQLSELVARIDRERFEPVVYGLADGTEGFRSAVEKTGVPVRMIGSRGVRRAYRLADALRRDSVDLVHSWLFIANSYAWMARLLGAAAPLVTSARNCKSQGKLHHVLNVAAFRGSVRIVVNSARVGEYVVRHYGAPRKRLCVIYNGVDTRRFCPAATKGEGPLTVMTAGRFVPQKNPLLFLEAAVRLSRKLPDTRFVMLGDGPQRSLVAERAAAAGLAACLELPGERADAEAWFQRADVFWLTSAWEGLPNAVLEAMACGVPVVATDVGGTRELFNSGVEGFLLRPGDAEGFVSSSQTLLQDNDRRARMGGAARERALQFSISRMVQAMAAVYAAVLGASL
jgi:glycosyltransferase involved in cell wall biosynthesis